MNTVTVSVKMNHMFVHTILDSGAGCSVIDLGSLENLGLAQNVTSSNHRLINASGKQWTYSELSTWKSNLIE